MPSRWALNRSESMYRCHWSLIAEAGRTAPADSDLRSEISNVTAVMSVLLRKTAWVLTI